MRSVTRSHEVNHFHCLETKSSARLACVVGGFIFSRRLGASDKIVTWRAGIGDTALFLLSQCG